MITGTYERCIISVGDSEASMDGYKLIYDGKQYLRGHMVVAEASDIGQISATIQTIGNFEVNIRITSHQKNLFSFRLTFFNTDYISDCTQISG